MRTSWKSKAAVAAGVAATLVFAAGSTVQANPPAEHAPAPKPAAPAAKPAGAPKPNSLVGAPPAAKPELKVRPQPPAPAGDGHGAEPAKPAMKPEPAKPAQPEPVRADDHAGGHAAPTAKPAGGGHEAPAMAPTADQALAWLMEGNARWVAGSAQHPNTDSARREAQAGGQTPFVAILTCADSRIPVERVFDRGVGEVFVVRVAGNVAGTSEGGTLEYGVEHLHTPLLVVMGHTKCGAVAAAASGAVLHGQVGELVSEIRPAVERARVANPNADEKALTSAAIRENVWQSVFMLLKNNATIRGKVKAGELRIVGAIYDVAEGKVEFLGSHPWQTELVSAMDARDARQGAMSGATAHASPKPAPAVPAKPAAPAPAEGKPSAHADAESAGHH